MEEKRFKKYLEDYIRVHNELHDVAEIERLEKEIKENKENLIARYYTVKPQTKNVEEESKAIAKDIEKFTNNIDNANKEIEKLKKNLESQKTEGKLKKNLESQKTEGKLKEEQKAVKQMAEEEKKRLLLEETNKYKYAYAYLEEEEFEIQNKLNEFKNIDIETVSFEDLEKIKQLRNELSEIRKDKDKKEKQISNGIGKLKLEAEYNSFLGLISMVDQHNDRVSVEGLMKERQEKEEKQQKQARNVLNDRTEFLDKIEKAKQEMENTNRDYKNINIETHAEIEKEKLTISNSGKAKITNPIKPKQTAIQEEPLRIETGKIQRISIDEKEGKIYTKTEVGKASEQFIHSSLWSKKENYEKMGIKEMCKEIAGGRVSGLLLRAKVNPAIVHSLMNEPETLKEYISCLHEKRELPFELVHDLRNSKLGFMERRRMAVRARAEDKIPGTKITFAQRFWNKNKTIEEAKETTSKTDSLEQYRNVIDPNQQAQNTQKILEQQEKQRGEVVQEALKEQDNEKY